jgi:glycerophosphoryl diester phosphodiesterase
MPWLIAHRGAMAEAPENTKSSFDKALSYPIDGIELDVQITRDCIPVIFHDNTINKKTDGTGRISDYTYSELCDFDWGAWFSADYRGEKILTLQQVLTNYSHRTRLLIEIKSPPHPGKALLYSRLPTRIIQMIRQAVSDDFMNNIFILSFDQALLASAYEQAPGLHYVLNMELPIFDSEKLSVDMKRLYGFCLAFSKLTPDFISWCHQCEKKIMTYSCNTPERIRRAFALKIDAVMTDAPGAVMNSFEECKKRILTMNH